MPKKTDKKKEEAAKEEAKKTQLNDDMFNGIMNRVEFKKKDVVCNELKPYIDKVVDGDLTITVKGLNGWDYENVRHEADRLFNELFVGLLEGYRKEDPKEIAEIKKKLVGTMGSSEENRDAYDIQKKVSFVQNGIVSPSLERRNVLTILGIFPKVFYRLYKEIEELSNDLVDKKKH